MPRAEVGDHGKPTVPPRSPGEAGRDVGVGAGRSSGDRLTFAEWWRVNAVATDRRGRPRTLIHPGRSNPVRIQSLSSATSRQFRLLLSPGRSLLEGLVDPLREEGVTSASMTILGGMFEELDYCVAPPDPLGRSVVSYSAPIRAGCVRMIFGNATLGLSLVGEPLVHCHAAIATASGDVKGGHVVPERSVVGPHPITVLVTSAQGIELRQSHDPETNMRLLQPRRTA